MREQLKQVVEESRPAVAAANARERAKFDEQIREAADKNKALEQQLAQVAEETKAAVAAANAKEQADLDNQISTKDAALEQQLK